MGAAGVLVLVATGVPTSTEEIPWEVIGIIMSVICTVAAAAGGQKQGQYPRGCCAKLHGFLHEK